MSSEEDNQITDTSISNIMDKNQYDNVSESGQGIKKRKKTKGKKTKGKKSRGKKTKGKKIKGKKNKGKKTKGKKRR